MESGKREDKTGWLKRHFYKMEKMPDTELIEYIAKCMCQIENAIDNLGYDLDYHDPRERQILKDLTAVSEGMVLIKNVLAQYSEQNL